MNGLGPLPYIGGISALFHDSKRCPIWLQPDPISMSAMAQDSSLEKDNGQGGWTQFPTNVTDWNVVYWDSNVHAERIQALSSTLFSDSDINVEVAELHSKSSQ